METNNVRAIGQGREKIMFEGRIEISADEEKYLVGFPEAHRKFELGWLRFARTCGKMKPLEKARTRELYRRAWNVTVYVGGNFFYLSDKEAAELKSDEPGEVEAEAPQQSPEQIAQAHRMAKRFEVEVEGFGDRFNSGFIEKAKLHPNCTVDVDALSKEIFAEMGVPDPAEQTASDGPFPEGEVQS